jgi:hypothetical protein
LADVAESVELDDTSVFTEAVDAYFARF